MGVEEHRLRVMGCDAHLILVDPHPGGAEAAMERLHELERRWSRFLADSELSQLNTAGGEWRAVSHDTLVLIATMQRANLATDGAYDPTFLHELLEIGYTHSLDDPQRLSVTIDLPCPGQSVHDIEMDQRSSVVRLPDALALDAGGIGKGLAADLVVAELLDAGTHGALVSIGGDLCAGGRPPTGEAWMVDIADPGHSAEPVTRLSITGGGVATSSTLARRSVRRGESRHHTIDPLTRVSSTTDMESATVIAATGWQAEAHATASLIAGAEGAVSYAITKGVSAFVICGDGRRLRSADLEQARVEDLSGVASRS